MKIKLRKVAFNIEVAIFENLIFKLRHAFSNPLKPQLQIFKNTPLAQEKEWSIYGPGEEEKVVTLEFKILNESKVVSFDEKRIEVKFLHQGKEKYNYPTGIQEVNFYEFMVLDVNRFKSKN